MIKHKIFVAFFTLFLIGLAILIIKLPDSPDSLEDINKNSCITDSDCANDSICIDNTCEALIEKICKDMDYKSIYQQTTSRIIYRYPSKRIIIQKEQDTCINNKTLLEWFCENGTLKNQTFECENNCSEGKCVLHTTIKGTVALNEENYISLEEYGLKDLALNIEKIIHNNTNGYNYAYITLINLSSKNILDRKKIMVGSFTVFKYKEKYIKVSAPSIYTSLDSLNSAVQLKVNIGKEYAQYYTSSDKE